MQEATPISVGDAASMLKRKIPNNEKPYTVEAIKFNNSKVDRWKRDVLDKIAVNGTVPAGNVWNCYTVYEEGIAVKELMDLLAKELIPRITEEQKKWWMDLFDKSSISELMKIGNATQKYEKIYSLSDDPYDWEKSRHSHKDLFSNNLVPEWYWSIEVHSNIAEKLKTIIDYQVVPQK